MKKIPPPPQSPDEIIENTFKQMYYWNIIESLLDIVSKAFYDANYNSRTDFDHYKPVGVLRQAIGTIRRSLENKLFQFKSVVSSAKIKQELNLLELANLKSTDRDYSKFVSFNGYEQDIGYLSEVSTKNEIRLNQDQFNDLIFFIKKKYLDDLNQVISSDLAVMEAFSKEQVHSLRMGLDHLKRMESFMFSYLDKMYYLVNQKALSNDSRERDEATQMYDSLNSLKEKYISKYKRSE